MTLQNPQMVVWGCFSADVIDEVDVWWMKGSDEPFSFDVDVDVTEQVDVWYANFLDALLLLSDDVHEDALMRQTRLDVDVLDKHLCLDVNVLANEQVDERWADEPDESVLLDVDVNVDG